MNHHKLVAGTVLLAALTLGTSSGHAQAPTNAEYYPFAEVMAMKMIDKNKDGMVSRQEFLDMMAMSWDMNAKKMGVKGDRMTPQQFSEILMYLKAGG